MKIAIFSDNFYPELSGIADSIISLAKELVRHENTIDFFVPYYTNKNYADANVPVKEIDLENSVTVTHLPSISYPSPTLQGRLAFWNKSIIKIIKDKDPEIIHTQLFLSGSISLESKPII